MASIKKMTGKSGTSYKITVTEGRTHTGRQIRHYKTWKPDRPMTEKQMEKEVRRVAFEFERMIEHGIEVDNKQTFEEYASYVIELKKQHGLSPSTVVQYKRILEIIKDSIGHLRLNDIRPQRLNALYFELSERSRGKKAFPASDISALLKRRKETALHFSKGCGFSSETGYNICRGKAVTIPIAEKVAQYLDCRIDSLFSIVEEAPISTDYVRAIHRFINTVMNQAEREMIVLFNPASRATPPQGQEPIRNYLQPEEVHAFLDILEDEPIRIHALFHLFLVTGARRGELLSLKWNDVDFQNNRLLIDSSLSYSPGYGKRDGSTKTKNFRYVDIPEETKMILRKYKKWQTEQRFLNGDRWKDEGYIFTTDDGSPLHPTTVNFLLSHLCEKHGFRHINPHAFRHTAASIMIGNGVDVVTVSKILGHKNPSMTTDVYSHVIEEAKRNASEISANIILKRRNA